MTLQIPISLEAKKRLINTWGPEVILKCRCGERPSHTMFNQYGSGKCPTCKETCQSIVQDWGIPIDGS